MTDLPLPEVPAIPHPFGPPPVEGVLRAAAEDFRVEERLSFPLAGEGGHLYLHVEKREANTEWVARRLAARAGVKPREVGYAGLKDRHAVTRQWFSLPPERAPTRWEGWQEAGYRVLEVVPHPRKLRRGALAENRFTLVVRGVTGDRIAMAERLDRVARRGVPNAFGEQRFGIGGGNLA
ncbi:MAG TPA: tRNA pseudouridine(13) synthase TruD, partial [Thiotrichales bacterium]|nr:tRNA pseudouridine(13) synthase TruD [Thiotrichales bacterium]